MARAGKLANGRFTKVLSKGDYDGHIGEFSRTNSREAIGKKVLAKSPTSVGGKLRDSKGNPTGHNYTIDKDGNKLDNTTGQLTKRQKYYDRRTGLGMVGG